MSTTRYCSSGHRFDIQGTMAVGETVTVTVTPAEGYQFVSWADGNTENPRTIYIAECGVTYTARFNSTGPGPTPPTPDTYNITVDVTPSGSGTTSGSGSYTSGTSVQISATPNPGWEFSKWSDGISSRTRTIRVTGDATYTAIMTEAAPGNVNITVGFTPTAASGYGVSSYGGGSYAPGSTATIGIIFTSQNSYQFGEWADNQFNANPRSITVPNTDWPYTAKLKVYTAISSRGHGTAAIQNQSGANGYFYPGTSLTLTANPDSGYHFKNWTVNGTQVSTSQQYSLSVGNTPAIYQANFEQDTQTTICYWLSDDNDYDNLKKDVTVYYHSVSQSGNTITIVPGAEGSSTSFGWFTAVVIPADCAITTAFWTDGLGGVNNLTFIQRTDAGLNIPNGYKCMVASAKGTTAGYQNGAAKTKIVITR